MKKIQSDLLSLNVSWFLEDLKLYDDQYGYLESVSFTVARLVTLIMAIIVHRAFYKLMKRLPGRPVNQMIYPHMVICLCNNQFLSFFKASSVQEPYVKYLVVHILEFDILRTNKKMNQTCPVFT